MGDRPSATHEAPVGSWLRDIQMMAECGPISGRKAPESAPAHGLSDRAQGPVSRWRPRQEGSMDTTTLLIILIVVLILFGGGWYGRGRWF